MVPDGPRSGKFAWGKSARSRSYNWHARSMVQQHTTCFLSCAAVSDIMTSRMTNETAESVRASLSSGGYRDRIRRLPLASSGRNVN